MPQLQIQLLFCPSKEKAVTTFWRTYLAKAGMESDYEVIPFSYLEYDQSWPVGNEAFELCRLA